MHKNQIWIAFLITILLVVLWFTAVTAYKFYRYEIYSKQVPLQSIKWFVSKHSEDRYLLEASYSYIVNDKTYEGKDMLEYPFFRNEWSAREGIPEMDEKTSFVWIIPKSESHSILYKVFPIKELIYTGILWILLIYFIWLGYYVNKRRRKWS